MIAQRHLNLSISHRTVLVTTDMVRAALGVDADSVAAKVDAGELRWAFDVSVGVQGQKCNGQGLIRELRFWAKEIIAPESTLNLTVAEAINQILGAERMRWRGTEIQHLLLVSRPTVMRLHHGGELPGEIVGNTLWVTRSGIQSFLKSRLTQ